jgi:hypothetical protein
MPDREIIVAFVQKAERRRRANRFREEFCFGFAVSLAFPLGLKLMDLLFALPWVMVVIGLVIWLVALVAYSVRLRGRKETLAWNDELRTAVWFINNNRTSNWIEGQIQRAAQSVRALDVDELYPGDIPRSLYAVMAMVLLVAGLNFVKPSQNQNWMALKAALLERIEDLPKSTAPKPTDRINPPPVTDAAAQSIPALLQGAGSQSALPIGKLATINGPPGNEPLGQEPFGEPVPNPTRMGPPTTLKVQLELEKLSGQYNESKKKDPGKGSQEEHSQIDYRNVASDLRPAQKDVLSRDSIPRSYRPVIRDYFQAIRPLK